ncbi:pyruvate dehydrogenase E2 component (dihydrolipoamide acetyltransferase) [Arboricoccus pini]|uniref:Acetyltransferase component of pyruvate dehydrogenase complex n=1 Tax=Arboricoccus pini TaxID=1963835 RepID=A0A212QNY8_9PROT|nr:pyruvate dehydrogenase complex dihydrolipoamide acetyltransferase [Arboricoccus pini]SNB61113.1 pyruvate dehydrogenase E2 component (dihydrolipoamide acetyltransferase) [Arboricoccus pini]
MPIKILMPALSPTMTEGNLARWLKKEGDEVKSGDIIAEIETDKATMEFEAVDEGKLGKIVVPEGTEGVKVNEVIGLLLEDGEDPATLNSAGSSTSEKPEASSVPSTPPASAPAKAVAAEVADAPKDDGRTGGADLSPSSASIPQSDGGGRIFASPLAKRLAAAAKIDLSGLKGSGPHGRIVKADIEAAEKGTPVQAAPSAPAAASPAPARAADVAESVAAPIEVPSAPHDVIQLNTMRKTIAKRLTQSKQTIPHFYLTIDVNLDALMDMRATLNGRAGADYKLSVNDFVIKAVAVALKRKPDANAAWGGDKVFRFKDIDVSVAVAIEGGLITPIVKKADQKGLATISNEMKDLAKRAREGKLKPEEFQGGGFSISNLGMFGIREFAAVINPPQACILAVGAGEKRAIVVGSEIKIATMMTVTLSVDHRVVDGALGAEFLAEFKKLVEEPLSLLL